MKNITVLAIAWVVWFGFMWFMGGVGMDTFRVILILIISYFAILALIVSGLILWSEGRLFDKFLGEQDD